MPSRILWLYGDKCAVCRRGTRILHEIVPKSLARFDWKVWWNRIALCPDCHTRVHDEGSQNWAERLRAYRNQRFLQYHQVDLTKVLNDDQ